MSGLESFAAVLGIADVGFRSVSLLYDSIKELQSVPKVIAGLKDEIEALLKCLSGLQDLLQSADDSVRALVQRFGLPEAAKSCADACSILHRYISKESTTGKLSTRARLHFLVRRKEIMGVVEDISTAKGTTNLTVNVAVLALQMNNSSVSDSEKETALRDAEKTLTRLVENAKEQGNAETLSTAIEAQNELNSIKQTWKSEVTTDGDGNIIGVQEPSGKTVQSWNGKVATKGSGNRVGIVGKAGNVSDVEQTLAKDVNTTGNQNNVGVIL